MNEKLKGVVQIPIWIVTIFITLLVTAFSMTFTFAIQIGQSQTDIQNTKIEQNKINTILEKKANKEDFDRIYIILDRIENKLDNHIEKK